MISGLGYVVSTFTIRLPFSVLDRHKTMMMMAVIVAAIGCADFSTPTGTVVDRQGDTAVIRCTADEGPLTVHCVNGTWTPTPPTAGCLATTSGSAAAVQTFHFGTFVESKQGRLRPTETSLATRLPSILGSLVSKEQP